MSNHDGIFKQCQKHHGAAICSSAFKAFDPMVILRQATKTSNIQLLSQFINCIRHLYRFQIFKNFLDIALSLCSEKRLRFVVSEKIGFEIDAGNCRTISGRSSDGSCLSKQPLSQCAANNSSTNDSVDHHQRHGLIAKLKTFFRRDAAHIITIRHIGTDTIIHEIAHMIEYEFSSLFAIQDFVKIFLVETNNVLYGVKNGTANSLFGLCEMLQRIIINGTKQYPENQKNAEYFARFFELFASSIEVALNTTYSSTCNLSQLYESFPQTLRYISDVFNTSWHSLINPRIAQMTKQYVSSNIRIGSSNASWRDKTGSIHAFMASEENSPAMVIDDNKLINDSCMRISSGQVEQTQDVTQAPRVPVAPKRAQWSRAKGVKSLHDD